MSRAANGLWLAAAAVWSWSCVATPPPPPAPAQLSVEVLRGGREVPSPASPPRLDILLDLTPSMKRRTAAGPSGLAAARAAAGRLVRSLPSDRDVALYGYGFTTGMECAPGARLASAAAGEPRDYLLERAAQTGAYTEGSLAEALDAVRSALIATDAIEGAQVVVLTDLGPGCEGEPCAAALALVDAGARLDLVVLGEAEIPTCFESRVSDSAPAALEGVLPELRVPSFSVESVSTTESLSPGFRATGRADGTPLHLPSGSVIVVVGLEPRYRIGPFPVPPHSLTQIRVLDFPHASEPVREWDRQVRALPATAEPAAAGNGEGEW